MARRVNTKFVVILSSALIGAVGVFGGVKLYRSWRNGNPEYVLARAEAAQKNAEEAKKNAEEAQRTGGASDADKYILEAARNFNGAVQDYSAAAHLMSVKHQVIHDPADPNPDHWLHADELFARNADLCMKLSREAQIQQDAVVYYQRAMENYNAALAENPLNKAVNETLLEEDYQNALSQLSIPAWKQVEEVAGKLIKNQDGVKPRLYRAEARLAQTTGVADPTGTAKNIGDIDADLQAALRFDPQSGKAVSLKARLMAYQAALSAGRRGLAKADEFNKDGRFQAETLAARQILVCYLKRRPWPCAAGRTWFMDFSLVHLEQVNSEVAATLAEMSIQQYELSGQADRSRLDAAAALLEAALAADSSKGGLAEELGQIYLFTGNPEKVEALYRQLVLKSPDAPENYSRLARFLRDSGKTPEAIAAFVDVTHHSLVGSGRDARRNLESQIVAYNEIAWLNMELAERPNTTDAQVKEYLKNAADATDKLRAANALKGLVDLLDGRSLLIRHDVFHAKTMLRSAEASLSVIDNPFVREKYRATELLLARANEQENQLGAALDLVNKALEIKSDNPVMLQKGRLLLQLGRFSDAQILMGKILGETDAGRFTKEASLPLGVAEAAKSYWKLADLKLHKGAPIVTGDNVRNALMALDSADFDAALAYAMTVLEKAATNADTDNLAAYQVAINCSIQLKRPDEAKKFAAEALAKYPDNTAFQVAKAKLDQPGGVDSFEAQKAIINSITDSYVRALNLAALFHRQKLWDEEIKVLQEVRATIKTVSAPEDREKLNSVLDRQFLANLTAYANASETASKSNYLKELQGIVGDLEKLNYDGTDGKIYQGRLELAKTDGKNGLQYLQQAVAQRPDYAYAHLILGQSYLALASYSAAKTGASSTTNTNLALEEFRTVVRLAPNNLAALENAIDLLVRKGDSSSLKEAQTLLESGLAQYPHNSGLIGFTELFAEKVDDSIAMREDLRKQQPQDRNNIHRLAALYVRKKDIEVDAGKKQDAMNRAIALIKQDYEDFKDAKDALLTADMLAHMLVEYQSPAMVPPGADGATIDAAQERADTAAADAAAKAIDLYTAFVDSSKLDVKFDGLIVKAEFFRKLQLRPGAYQKLLAAKILKETDLRLEAADILRDAIKIEPAERDDADRHLADMYFDMGNFAEAEKVYLQVLAGNKKPDDMDRVNRRLIEAQLREAGELAVKKDVAGADAKYAQAMPRLNELLKKNDKDIQGLILRAYASTQQGLSQSPAEQAKRLQAALADLNQVLAQDPGNADALFYRATAQLSLGDRMDDAERDLIQASKRDKSAVNSRVLLAELYVRTQRYEQASGVYREVLKDHPELLSVRVEYTDLLKNLADLATTLPKDSDVDFVLSLRRLSPAEKLMDEISDAEKIYPNQLRWPLLYAQTLSIQGKEAESLRYYKAYYDLLDQQHVLDAGLCDGYLGALLKNKDYDTTIKLSTNLITNYMDFITKNPQFVSFFLKRAAAYQAKGQQDLAIKDIDQAFEVGVGAVKTSNDFGPYIAVLSQVAPDKDSQGQAGGVVKAELVAERLRERLKTNPGETISQIGLIQTLLIMNDDAGALKVVEGMAVPTDNSTLRFLVLREAALVRAQNKDFAGAEKDYKELVSIAPGNVEVLNNYAFMLADAGRPKESIIQGENALKLLSTHSDPNQLSAGLANLLDTLGWAYCLNNELDKAAANLKKSLNMEPQPATWLHLALAQQKMGGPQLDSAAISCKEGIKLAVARHDAKNLAALKEVQSKVDPKAVLP